MNNLVEGIIAFVLAGVLMVVIILIIYKVPLVVGKLVEKYTDPIQFENGYTGDGDFWLFGVIVVLVSILGCVIVGILFTASRCLLEWLKGVF